VAELSTIKSAINTVLSGVSALKDVEPGRVVTFDAFPAARFYLSGVGTDFLDTARDYRLYEFTVEIVMPLAIEGVTRAQAEEELHAAVDATMDAIGNEWTLDGNVESAKFETGRAQEVDWGFGPAIALPIVLNTRTVIALS
jgi:hypothetical protein